MRKIFKIAGIIVGCFLTLVGLFKLIPSQSLIGVWLHNLSMEIENNFIWSTGVSLIILLFGGIILVTMAFNLKEEKKHHTFEVGSKKFCSYFAKWYSRSGAVSIICDDLEGWTNPNGDSTILDELKKKSAAKELHLFLGKESPIEVIDELRQLGATIEQAPLDIITNYSFSCLSVMGNYSAVIVRNKQMDKSTRIIFEEISNSYISGLLNTLIKEGDMNGQRKYEKC